MELVYEVVLIPCLHIKDNIFITSHCLIQATEHTYRNNQILPELCSLKGEIGMYNTYTFTLCNVNLFYINIGICTVTL